MNRDDFVRANEALWTRTESLIAALDKRRTVQHELAELPELYRRCCHHLALVRQRRYDQALESRLNRIALRGYTHLYRQRRGDRSRVWHFIAARFPRLVREYAGFFWLATALLYGPGIAMGMLVLAEPEAVYTLLDARQVAQFEEMYNSEIDEARGAETDWTMFGFYVFNNVSVAFRTFAFGLFAGVGTLFILAFNGLLLGAVFAHLTHVGTAENLLTFVVTHGAFELTAIVIAGVAGLRLGSAIVAPGRMTRVEALKKAAPDCACLISGVAVMLILAAVLEAYWSASAIDSSIKLMVGAAAWVAVAAGLLLGGRRLGA